MSKGTENDDAGAVPGVDDEGVTPETSSGGSSDAGVSPESAPQGAPGAVPSDAASAATVWPVWGSTSGRPTASARPQAPASEPEPPVSEEASDVEAAPGELVAPVEDDAAPDAGAPAALAEEPQAEDLQVEPADVELAEAATSDSEAGPADEEMAEPADEDEAQPADEHAAQPAVETQAEPADEPEVEPVDELEVEPVDDSEADPAHGAEVEPADDAPPADEADAPAQETPEPAEAAVGEPATADDGALELPGDAVRADDAAVEQLAVEESTTADATAEDADEPGDAVPEPADTDASEDAHPTADPAVPAVPGATEADEAAPGPDAQDEATGQPVPEADEDPERAAAAAEAAALLRRHEDLDLAVVTAAYAAAVASSRQPSAEPAPDAQQTADPAVVDPAAADSSAADSSPADAAADGAPDAQEPAPQDPADEEPAEEAPADETPADEAPSTAPDHTSAQRAVSGHDAPTERMAPIADAEADAGADSPTGAWTDTEAERDEPAVTAEVTADPTDAAASEEEQAAPSAEPEPEEPPAAAGSAPTRTSVRPPAGPPRPGVPAPAEPTERITPVAPTPSQPVAVAAPAPVAAAAAPTAAPSAGPQPAGRQRIDGGPIPPTPRDPSPLDDFEPDDRPSRAPRVLAVLGIVVLLVVGAYVAASFALGDKVPRGATVAGVPIGGLSREDAVARLDDELADATTGPVEVVANDVQASIDPAKAGLAFDAEGTVDALVGTDLLEPARLWRQVAGVGAVTPVTSVDEDALAAAIEELGGSLSAEPVDAGIVFVDESASTTKAKDGWTVDEEGAARTLESDWLTAARPVELPTTTVEPAITQAEADEAYDKVAKHVASAPVSVEVDERVAVLDPATVAANAAMVPVDGTLQLQMNGEKLAEEVVDQLPGLLTAAEDAHFTFVDGKPKLVEGEPGTKLDPDALAAAVATAASGSDRTATVELVPTDPEDTTKAMEELGITEVISEFKTPLTSEQRRTVNIRQGLKNLTGVLLRPGDEFSLTESLGPIDAQHGFVQAGVIVNGEHQDGIGGGLSQVSTTTFNAAYFAGFEILEHQPHSEWFSRYPEGREATMYLGSIDMRFKNDSPYGALIRGWVSGGYAHVQIWGTKYFEVASVTGPRSNVVSPRTVYSQSPTCVPQGAGNPGFRVSVTRTVTKPDGELKEKKSWTTSYRPQNRVVCGKAPSQDDGKKDDKKDEKKTSD